MQERHVPIFGVMQIGEAASAERSNEVEREGGVRVAGQEELRIGAARAGRKIRAIDEIAEVARELDAVLRLHRLRSRLGVLPGESTDANDRPLAGVNEHQGHLKKDLQL